LRDGVVSSPACDDPGRPAGGGHNMIRRRHDPPSSERLGPPDATREATVGSVQGWT